MQMIARDCDTYFGQSLYDTSIPSLCLALQCLWDDQISEDVVHYVAGVVTTAAHCIVPVHMYHRIVYYWDSSFLDDLAAQSVGQVVDGVHDFKLAEEALNFRSACAVKVRDVCLVPHLWVRKERDKINVWFLK